MNIISATLEISAKNTTWKIYAECNTDDGRGIQESWDIVTYTRDDGVSSLPNYLEREVKEVLLNVAQHIPKEGGR
tara:strand:+ start:110 stop:334 length:225 start_codon:yes stop_codon:yes gene_type:complete